jgi:hypothetical protein
LRLVTRKGHLDHEIGRAVKVVLVEAMQAITPEDLEVGQKPILAQAQHEALDREPKGLLLVLAQRPLEGHHQ